MAETYDINEISNNRSNTTDTNFLDAVKNTSKTFDSILKNINFTSFLKDDELFSQLENEDEPKHIREARLNELVLKALEKQFVQKNKFEIFSELTEDDFINVTTKTKKCIIHFYHPDFNRCNIINTHLQVYKKILSNPFLFPFNYYYKKKIASKFTDIRFAKINVDKAKFFVNKLKIQVLPAILCFMDGIVRDK
jgi:hypothetical protein